MAVAVFYSFRYFLGKFFGDLHTIAALISNQTRLNCMSKSFCYVRDINHACLGNGNETTRPATVLNSQLVYSETSKY